MKWISGWSDILLMYFLNVSASNLCLICIKAVPDLISKKLDLHRFLEFVSYILAGH